MEQCIVCGKSFTSERGRRYCRDACRRKQWKLTQRENYLAASKRYNKKYWEKNRPIHSEKSCKYCDKVFMPSRMTPNQPYCSNKCRVTEYRTKHIEDVRRWRRESYRRHKETKHKIDTIYKDKIRFDGNRIKALERDGHICQNCDSKGPRLNVHHKDGTGQTDDPNNELDNLVTLCAACHKRIHRH